MNGWSRCVGHSEKGPANERRAANRMTRHGFAPFWRILYAVVIVCSLVDSVNTWIPKPQSSDCTLSLRLITCKGRWDNQDVRWAETRGIIANAVIVRTGPVGIGPVLAPHARRSPARQHHKAYWITKLEIGLRSTGANTIGAAATGSRCSSSTGTAGSCTIFAAFPPRPIGSSSDWCSPRVPMTSRSALSSRVARAIVRAAVPSITPVEIFGMCAVSVLSAIRFRTVAACSQATSCNESGIAESEDGKGKFQVAVCNVHCRDGSAGSRNGDLH